MRAAKHIATYATGNIVRQLAGFVMLPIYTSYLTPGDYGVVGLLVVMVALFELVIGARFAQSIPKFYYDQSTPEGRNQVVSTALMMTSAVSVVSTLLVASGSSIIAEVLLGSVDYQEHVALFGVTLLTAAIEAYGLAYFRLQEKPVLFVVNSVSKLVVQLSLNIYLVVHLEMGVMGVIVSNLMASAAFAIFAACYIFWHTGFGFNSGIIVSLFRFSWPLWLAGLASLYIGSSNRVFIRIFSSLDEVGLFELAWKFAAILPMLVWRPFAQWWQTERFKIYHQEGNGLAVYPVVFNAASLVLIYFAAGICLFNETVIYYMSSESFHAATIAVPLLVFGILCESLTSFFFFSFLVKEKTLIITYLRYGSGVVITIGSLALIPFFGFVGAAIAYAISNMCLLLASYVWSKRVFDSNISLDFAFRLLSVSLIIVISANHLIDMSMGLEIAGKALVSVGLLAILLALAKRDDHLFSLYERAFKFLRKRIFAKE